MKTTPFRAHAGWLLLPLGFVLLAPHRAQAAVDFTVSPVTINNSFQGTITVTITGLDPGQGCRLSKFFDANANGQIDPGEPLVANFGLRDSQVMLIGGVRLGAVPGDEDRMSNGVVRAEFSLASQGELESVAAPYLYRVSHPTNAFPPLVKPFTVTPYDFGQSFTGTVMSGGSNVPGAGVVALTGLDGEFAVGVTANSLGQYSLSVPPGTYQLLVVREGYVCSFSQMPVLDLGPGQTVATNLPLVAATHTISGQLRVAQATNVLAGFQAFCDSDSGEFAMAYTDANGNFSFGVTPGVWGIDPAEHVVSAHGLLFPRDPVQVDATTGSVAGLLFELPRATALVYGSVKDSQNTPIGGLSVWCDSGTIPLAGSGMTDANGEFSVGIIAGDWWLGFSQETLAAAGLILQSTNVTLTDGQAQRVDFVARRATAHLRGFVRKPDGSPLSDQSLYAWSNDGSSGNRTAADGSFDLPVFAGSWTLQLEDNEAQAAGVMSPRLDLTVTDGVDVNSILVIARPITARITGRVATTGGMPLANLGVYALADFGTNHYDVGMNTDANGYYTLDVADGTWLVNLNCNDLQDRGYSCPSQATVVVVVADVDRVRDFTVDTTPTPPSFGSPTVSGGEFRCTVSGQTGRSYRVRSTTDLVNWTDLGIYLGPSFEFVDPVPPGSQHRFYRVQVVP